MKSYGANERSLKESQVKHATARGKMSFIEESTQNTSKRWEL
jgi:hypothetical protein